MLEFKVITSPDKSQQATYQHTGKELILGKSEGDMIIDDPALSPRQLRIYFQGEQAYLENLNPDVDIRLNGKAISGATTIKEKDNLTVGRTTINITQADLRPYSPPEPYTHPQAAQRVVPGSKEKALLEVLEHLAATAGDTAPANAAPPPLPGGAPKPPLPPKPPIPRK
jgi:hypothetical protein